MDSESIRQLLAASQLCEEALVEWITKGIGYPQIFIHKFLTQSEDVFNTIDGASFAVDGEVPSDIAEFNIWLGDPPISRSSAHQIAAELLINISQTVSDALNQLGYSDRSPILQNDHTTAFFDSDAVTIGDWAYAHQHQVAEALGRQFSPPDFRSSCEEAGIDEVEFNRMIARMQRERTLVEKEFSLVAVNPVTQIADAAAEIVDRIPTPQPADGPFEPNSFRYQEKIISGLRPTPYRLLKALWNADGWTRLFDDSLARDVWLEHGRDIDRGLVDGHQKRLNNCFLKEQIHLRVRVEKDKVILKELSEDDFKEWHLKRNTSGKK